MIEDIHSYHAFYRSTDPESNVIYSSNGNGFFLAGSNKVKGSHGKRMKKIYSVAPSNIALSDYKENLGILNSDHVRMRIIYRQVIIISHEDG